MHADAPTDQRTRIIDAALTLMGEQGAQPTSMRQLANACGINVATLYHYFPSKSDLLRAVIEERNYLDGLAVERPPVGRRGSPEARFAALVRWIFEAAAAEEEVWKLVLGETVRGEEAALTMARQLTNGLEEAIARWIAEVVPEFDGDGHRAARVVRATLFAGMIQLLVSGSDDRERVLEQGASDAARVSFRGA